MSNQIKNAVDQLLNESKKHPLFGQWIPSAEIDSGKHLFLIWSLSEEEDIDVAFHANIAKAVKEIVSVIGKGKENKYPNVHIFYQWKNVNKDLDALKELQKVLAKWKIPSKNFNSIRGM